MKLVGNRNNQENFKSCPYKNVHPDIIAKDYISDAEEQMEENEENEEEEEEEEDKFGLILNKLDKQKEHIDKSLDRHRQHDNEYVKKTNVELAAKSAVDNTAPFHLILTLHSM